MSAAMQDTMQAVALLWAWVSLGLAVYLAVEHWQNKK